jgi:hypothetical protein
LGNEQETAEELSKYFKSVYVEEDTTHIPDFKPEKIQKPTEPMNNIIITEDGMYKKLAGLNRNKSPGPDSFHPMVLKNGAKALTYPLTMLYKKSLETGILPFDWKSANVTPIFKKGNRSQAANYRPVSLTSVPCKLLESFIRDSTVRHMEQNDLLSRQQHGLETPFMLNKLIGNIEGIDLCS